MARIALFKVNVKKNHLFRNKLNNSFYSLDHRSTCVCPDGTTGNPLYSCQEIGCRSDGDCSPVEACINRECVDKCSLVQCAKNAYCKADGHVAR